MHWKLLRLRTPPTEETHPSRRKMPATVLLGAGPSVAQQLQTFRSIAGAKACAVCRATSKYSTLAWVTEMSSLWLKEGSLYKLMVRNGLWDELNTTTEWEDTLEIAERTGGFSVNGGFLTQSKAD